MTNTFFSKHLALFNPAGLNLLLFTGLLTGFAHSALFAQAPVEREGKQLRQRILINDGWKFYKYETDGAADHLIYDVRPDAKGEVDDRPADAKPTDAVKVAAAAPVLKAYILPAGNAFIKDPAKQHIRPDGNPGGDFPFVQPGFDDYSWESVDLPHDWAIKGPFYKGYDAIIGGGMGRLPIQGVAWYRRQLSIPASDAGKSIFLDLDGAMSYAMVWLNGKLVGGWPYGYSSWRLNLTPYLVPGGKNQLAIRLDNPANSSRWYPGGGIYRNVWLTKVNPVHVGQWGTFLQTSKVTKASARIDLKVFVDNDSKSKGKFGIGTEIYVADDSGHKTGNPVAKISPAEIKMNAGSKDSVAGVVTIANPMLWRPLPAPHQARYVAVTTITANGAAIDRYETPFGIREIIFDPAKGVLVNGEKVFLKGVDQHSDLGPLGMAFNVRAAERQLEMLKSMGCNAIRMAHNPPAPELLELTDRMGFLVIDEIFDAWESKKPALDFHLIFPDWHEQDLRAMIRRDRNHPSVMLWSFGNEVGEQYSGEVGAKVAKRLYAIVKDEDPTRPATVAMNFAKPNMPLPAVLDVISLNYQGEGIRNGPAYAGLKGINTPPLFPAFHEKFPNKAIISSENAAALSSRGEYFFPVYEGNSSPVKDNIGGDLKNQQVSAYELYSVDFGSSADKVFATMARHPFVAGGFVWSGWDYLGEPTPYYLSRSSYFGIIDLAGFKKDRYYLYQSQWRPEMPMAHILPHWNWPDRLGQITPVHVFTSGDEAELFLNGKSLGRKKMAPFEYRLRWDSVKYEPGEVKVIAYKEGRKWAEEVVKTTGDASRLSLTADRQTIGADGVDLSFITVRVTDDKGLMVPRAKNDLKFSIEGPGEIVATDNGDAANLVSFPSPSRQAFNGLCLVIVRARRGEYGKIILKASSPKLKDATISITSVK
jgi:beta-galactosidase